MRRRFFLALALSASLSTGRVFADTKEDILKLLTKELQAQRDELARLREENKKLRAENEKLRLAAKATTGATARKGDEKAEKKPKNKLQAAIVGEWKQETGETWTFKANGEYTHRRPPVLTQGAITTIGRYRFRGDDALDANMIDLMPKRTNGSGFSATAALLQRSFHVEIDGDSLTLEQRKPLQAPRQEFQRQKKR